LAVLAFVKREQPSGAEPATRFHQTTILIDLTYKQIDRFKLRLGTIDKQTIDACLSSISPWARSRSNAEALKSTSAPGTCAAPCRSPS